MKSFQLVSGNPGQASHKTDTGAYQLILQVARPVVIEVGALGSKAFPAGLYIYTGRASKSLSKRIERHLRAEKRLRWHIDYLLQQAQIADVRVYHDKAAEECSINRETARVLQAKFPFKGFGSSDCRCTSHLILIPKKHIAKLNVIATGGIPRGGLVLPPAEDPAPPLSEEHLPRSY